MLGPGPQLGASWALGGKKKRFSSQRVEKRAQEEPHTRLEAEIQVAGGVPRAIALYVQKSFPPRHGESTRRDPEQQLRGRRQRGPGSWAEACEEEHHSGGRRQAPPGCGGNWREKAGPEQRLLDESLWGVAGETKAKYMVSIRTSATSPFQPPSLRRTRLPSSHTPTSRPTPSTSFPRSRLSGPSPSPTSAFQTSLRTLILSTVSSNPPRFCSGRPIPPPPSFANHLVTPSPTPPPLLSLTLWTIRASHLQPRSS